MKVIKVENVNGVYVVTLRPNIIEMILGKIVIQQRFKLQGQKHVYTDVWRYYRSDGRETGEFSSIAKAIDRFRNSF